MTSERLERQLARLLDEAERAVERSDWYEVERTAGQALVLDPENGEAKSFAQAAARGLAANGTAGRVGLLKRWLRLPRLLGSSGAKARPFVVPILFLGLITFLAADRLWLNWYVPTSETVAKELLGEWESSVVNEPGTPTELRTDSGDVGPPPSSPLLQFQSTIGRMARAVAIDRVDTTRLSSQAALNALHACQEFLLARTNAFEDCGFVLGSE